MKERLVYQCEYCPSVIAPITKTSAAMYKHENSCHFNLKNKTCLTCGNALNQVKESDGNFIDCNHYPEGNMYENPFQGYHPSTMDEARLVSKAEDFFRANNRVVRYGKLLIVKNCTEWKAPEPPKEDE